MRYATFVIVVATGLSLAGPASAQFGMSTSPFIGPAPSAAEPQQTVRRALPPPSGRKARRKKARRG